MEDPVDRFSRDSVFDERLLKSAGSAPSAVLQDSDWRTPSRLVPSTALLFHLIFRDYISIADIIQASFVIRSANSPSLS